MNKQRQAPIGYWLKYTHDTLEHRMDKVLSSRDLSRSGWQVLNLIHNAENGITKEGLYETMQTFVDPAGLETILVDFTAKGWLNPAIPYRLTDKGTAALNTASALIGDFRKQSMKGISEEEYATVLKVLQQMVTNLG